MFGQIHLTVKELVQVMFGQDTWEKVLAASKLDEDEHFMVFKQYPDEETFALFGAVSSTLGISLETVLNVLGGYFLTYCRQHGYDKMLTTLGGDLITFIQNLDSLHSLLSVSYMGIKAPSFRCVEDENGSLILHYYSSRIGLYPIVIGLIEAVGKDLFHQKATLTLLSQGQEQVGDSKSLYHAVLKVEVSDIPGETMAVQWAFGDAASYKHWTQMKARRPSFGADIGDRGTESFIRSEDFSTTFPYHILMDRRLLIRQCGENIKKLSMVAIKDGTPLQDVGTIVQPVIRQTSENIMTFINSVFIVAIHRKPGDQPFLLKGQMFWLTYSRLLLFVGSPRLMSLDDFKRMKVFLSDVPIYDVTRELVLLNQQRIAEIDVARKLDETTMALKKTSKALESEKRKTEELLHEMMPKKIAKQLTSGQKVKAERYESCTVLFSDIVTFTDIAAKCPADDIVNMLNDMYHRFDTHTDLYDVYKVETIGDAYMAVTGVPEIQDDHAERMADFAMDMMEEAGNVLSPATGKPLKIRVGMHTGSVVAGVIGRKKPRYDIYGDTVNAASRMESNSVPGRIHISNTTFSKLYPYGYRFLARGHIEVKGKGVMETYFLVGSSIRSISQPNDMFDQYKIIFNPNPEIRHKRAVLFKPVKTETSPEVKKMNIVMHLPRFKDHVSRMVSSNRTNAQRKSSISVSPITSTCSLHHVFPGLKSTSIGIQTATAASTSLEYDNNGIGDYHSDSPYFNKHDQSSATFSKKTLCACMLM